MKNSLNSIKNRIRSNKLKNIILLSYYLLVSLSTLGQAALVTDGKHTATSTIESTASTASTALKAIFENPAWKKISKVQEFFKEAATIVSAIIKNMRMTRELIEIEQEIFQLLGAAYRTMNETEYFPDKWVYRKAATELYYEKQKLFEVFDLAEQQNRGIIDDEGRILLIKEVYTKAKEIRAGMRSIMRRARKQAALYHRAKREIEVFGELFQ